MARTKIRWLAILMMLLGASPAMAAPVLDIFIDDVSDVPVGTTRLMGNGISNFGDATATITRMEIAGADAANFAFANPAAPACTGGQVCSDVFTIDAGGFSGLDITCTPDRPALFTASLVVTSDASNSPTSTTLFCDAAGPHIDFTPRTLTFPTTPVGYWSAPQVVQIHNTGSTTIRYTVGTAADFASSLDFVDCAGDPCFLAAGATISVSINFVPVASGTLTEQLVLAAFDGEATLPLIGTAVGPQLKVEQPPDFQTLNLGTTLMGTTTAPGTVRIRNIGNEALHVTSAALGFADSGAFVITAGPTEPFDLAPNTTADWQVACRPVRLGSNVSLFTIESNAGLPEFPVPLQCTGDGGALALDDVTLQLPTTAVGSSSTIPMVVRNIGDRPVTITAAGADDPQFTVALHAGSLPITVAPHAAATFDVTFSPTRGGDQSGQITIANDGVLPFLGVAHGVGHTGHVDVTPAAPAFGAVRVGTSSQLMVELGNHSDQPFTLTSITIGDPAQFQISDMTLIGAVIEPDEVLPFAIQATPSSLGPQDTEISFAFDQGSPTIAHVTATGTAADLAVETWDGKPSDGKADFGVVGMGSRSTGLLSVTNTGTATLQIASCSVVGDAAFSVSPNCTFELAPRASADLEVDFLPATTGRHTAILRFTSDASTTMLDVTLSGTATPRIGCAAGGDEGGGLAVLLVGFAAIRRRARRTRRSVAARVVGIALVLAGCGAGGSDETEALKPGHGTLTVTRTGTGTGVVTSLAHEIDCGTRCSTTFDEAIHLAATPATGSIFAGWDGPCVGTGPCVVTPEASPAAVIARFEHQFRLTITGDAPSSPFSGEVTVNGERCSLPCVRDLLEGTSVTLDAFTLSTFTGWTGGCTPTAAPCTLVITADVDLTAHFATPDERWTAVADDLVPTTLTVAGDDPVVAGLDGMDVLVGRYTSAGMRVWLTRFTAGPNPQIVGLDHNASGQVYILVHVDADAGFGTLILQKLDAGGQALWSTTIPDAASILIIDDISFTTITNHGLAVAPDGDVLILADQPSTGTFVRAYADDGNVHWTRTFNTAPLDVSVDADGVATVASEDQFANGRIDRYDPNGSLVVHYDLPDLPSDNFPEFSFQSFAVASGELICASADMFGEEVVIRAVDVATGAMIWWLDDLSPAINEPISLRTDGPGDIVMLDSQGAVRKLVGRTIAWRRASDHFLSPGGALDARSPSDVGGDSQGRAIEAGSWVRACAAGETCDPDGNHVSGFVRGYVP